MFFGTGAMSSVTQAAGASAGGARASPKTLVVLVKTKDSTPTAAASSSRLSVPVTLVSTKSWRLCVARWGLCRVGVWGGVCVGGGGVLEDRTHSGHAALHQGPIGDRADVGREGGNEYIEAD